MSVGRSISPPASLPPAGAFIGAFPAPGARICALLACVGERACARTSGPPVRIVFGSYVHRTRLGKCSPCICLGPCETQGVKFGDGYFIYLRSREYSDPSLVKVGRRGALKASAPDPHSRQLSPRTRPGSFPPCPPTQLCAQRACSRLPKAAGSSRQGSLRDSTCTMLRRHALVARPRRRQQLGDQHLREERQDELDAGSDDGRPTDLPSMPPLKPAQREAQCPAARSRSSAPSALSLPLLA